MRKFSIPLYLLVVITEQHFVRGEIHADADFSSLMKAPYFVDLSLIILDVFKHLAHHKCQVITTPHGFGKSTHIDLIKLFAQIEADENGNTIPRNQTSHYDLFVNSSKSNPLKIIYFYDCAAKDHLANYPVIHIELKNIVGSTLSEFLSNLTQRIRKAYQMYEWLYKLYSKKFAADNAAEKHNEKAQLAFMRKIFSNEELSQHDLQQSVAQLVDILFHYHNLKVFILIDDYDAPWIDVIKDKNNNVELSQIHDTMTAVFGKLLEPKVDKHIKYIWMAGTNSVPFPHNVKKTRYNRFMDPFTNAYHHNFNLQKIRDLVNRFKIDALQALELPYFYGGYYYPHSYSWTHVVRPSYVVKHLTKQPINESETTWIEHGDLTPLSMFLKNQVIRDKIKELLDTRKFSFNITRLIKFEHWQKLADIIRGKADPQTFDPNVFFTILFENGYLSYSEKHGLLHSYSKELSQNLDKYSTDDVLYGKYFEYHDFNVPNILMMNSFEKFLSLYKEND